MTDNPETPAAESQADDTAQAQAATVDTQVGDDKNEDVLTAADAKKLRSEARNLRERAKQAEKKLEERERQDMTELEKAQRERDEHAERRAALEADLRFTRVQLVAGKAGVRPEALEDIPKLLDWDLIDNPEDPKSLEKAVRQLLKEKPHLSLVTSGADAGARGTGESGLVDVNQIIRRAAGVR